MSELSGEEELRRQAKEVKRRAKQGAAVGLGVAAIVATGGAAAPLVMASAFAYGMKSMLPENEQETATERRAREAREAEEDFDEGPSRYEWTGRECEICKVATSPFSLHLVSPFALHLLTLVTPSHCLPHSDALYCPLKIWAAWLGRLGVGKRNLPRRLSKADEH